MIIRYFDNHIGTLIFLICQLVDLLIDLANKHLRVNYYDLNKNYELITNQNGNMYIFSGLDFH
jgi:hypothetical protein